MTLTKISLAAIALSVTIQQCAFAQPVATLREPLIEGANSSAPFTSAPEGQPPPVGEGATPAPVAPGMGGAPTLLPWVPAIPANTIDQGSSGISLPGTPAIESPAGVLGPSLSGVVPPPPSTPGADPGNLTTPPMSFNPAANENINPSGGIPGTGGFNTSIPNVRRGGQESHQYELRGRNSILGGGLGGDGSQDEIYRLGPGAWGVPYGVPTADGLRNSSIDLGGGQRFKAGGGKVSTGSSLQDYGLSVTRNNPIGALQADQSFEFGQGFHRMPLYSSKSTDFGFGYRQFIPANENPQKRDQLLLPKAVITNF